MVAQIYVKCNDDYTSMLVCKGDVIYFQDVLDAPEITGIQRCVSFVKHNLKAETTEIYPETLGAEILNDAFIQYCQVNPKLGETPNPKMQKACQSRLNVYMRWLIDKNNCKY